MYGNSFLMTASTHANTLVSVAMFRHTLNTVASRDGEYNQIIPFFNLNVIND